jgi:Polyketide cyclase / dehydrase and lipid transport
MRNVMADYGRSLETKAAPEAVWRLWSDTSTWPSWNPDVEEVRLDRPLSPGASGTMRTKSGGTHNVAITDVAPGRYFVLQSDGVPATKLLFKCEVIASSGGSRISQSVTLKGPLSFLFGPMMGGRIAQSFSPVLEGLSGAAERKA